MNDSKNKTSVFMASLMTFVLLLLLLNLAATLTGVRVVLKDGAPQLCLKGLYPGEGLTGSGTDSGAGAAEALKQLGLQLKSDRFLDEAGEAFEKYLSRLGTPGLEAAPGIYASLAADYFDVSEFRKALVYFYKAEASVKQLPENSPVRQGFLESMQKDWAAKEMACLENLGRTQDADLLLEKKLSSEGGEKDESPVLAIIGNQKLTLNEFNHEIQRLSKNVQEQLSKDIQSKKAFFYQWMLNRLLYKKALRLGKDKQPEMLQKIQEAKFQILAGSLLGEELGTIEPTLVDLKNYYQSHPHQFTKNGEKDPQPFEEVKKQVVEGYAMQKQNEKAKALMDKLMFEEHVRLFDENVV